VHYISLPNVGDFFTSPTFFPNFSSFSDGEISLDFSGFDFSNKPLTLVQSFFRSESSITQLMLAIDVVSRNTQALPHILLTYMSYTRQDREISQFSPISARVIANLISAQQIATVSIVDLHSPQIQGFFTKPCFNIGLEDFFLSHIISNFDTQNIVICAADIGGAKSARKISQKIGCESAIVEKIRPKAGVSQALSLIGSVSGKICIVVDDIIDSAGTLCNAADILMHHGASAVFAYATHGVFSGSAFDRIE
jgi:ribose-phosphate pyrophosphokinase